MKKYTTKNGVSISYNEISDEFLEKNKKHLIKINIPDTLDSYKTGNGEGMWAIGTIEDDIKKLEDSNSKGELIIVQLHNDCFYYQDDIKFLDYIVVETRGVSRPVVPYKEVEDYFCYW